MGRRCCISDCRSNNSDNTTIKKIALFKVPEDSRRERWLQAITPHVKTKKGTKHYHVCQKHFKQDDLLLQNPIQLKDGKIVPTPRYKASIKPDSIPCIFGAMVSTAPTASSSPTSSMCFTFKSSVSVATNSPINTASCSPSTPQIPNQTSPTISETIGKIPCPPSLTPTTKDPSIFKTTAPTYPWTPSSGTLILKPFSSVPQPSPNNSAHPILSTPLSSKSFIFKPTASVSSGCLGSLPSTTSIPKKLPAKRISFTSTSSSPLLSTSSSQIESAFTSTSSSPLLSTSSSQIESASTPVAVYSSNKYPNPLPPLVPISGTSLSQIESASTPVAVHSTNEYPNPLPPLVPISGSSTSPTTTVFSGPSPPSVLSTTSLSSKHLIFKPTPLIPSLSLKHVEASNNAVKSISTTTFVPSKTTALRAPICAQTSRPFIEITSSKSQMLTAAERNAESFSSVSPTMNGVPSMPLLTNKSFNFVPAAVDKTPTVSTAPSTDSQSSEYNLNCLIHDLSLHSRKLPDKWGYCNITAGLYFFYYGDAISIPTRSILVKADMTTEIRAHFNIVQPNEDIKKVHNFHDLLAWIVRNTSLSLCKGIDEYTTCPAGFFDKKLESHGRCISCQIERKRRTDIVSIQAKRTVLKLKNTQKFKKNVRRKCSRLEIKVINSRNEIQSLKKKCATASEHAVEDAIKNMPVYYQQSIRACLTAAKCKGPTGMRYTHSWVLECLLLRIKSRQGYLHLRTKKILPVPTIGTLNKYLKNLKPSYGFSEQLFRLMRLKAEKMDPKDRRGTLVIDEMQVSPASSFDSGTLCFGGFTYLGSHTPETQKNKRGDHALVFLFQPFRGSWVQTVAAFLSLGCADSNVLTKLTLECIILLERAGFFVDVVTTDGATWNRAMWKKFGVTEDSCKCEHPCSVESDEQNPHRPKRYLRFSSDFSHLLKIMRNLITNAAYLDTPDGRVKLAHFEAVLESDGIKSLGLKIAHKLRPDDVHPRFYQKMNVGMALRFFAPEVSTAMKIYKTENEHLHDCEGTVKFIERFRKVIVAMSSRSSQNALAYNTDSYKIINDFCEYLKNWRDQALENNWRFLSDNSYQGFQVTLKTAVETMIFLTEECGYDWLMTARLNQDALEGFFGMVRSACGSSDHPDSLLFIQVYRLMTFYSLVKPPKGCNVEGIEIFETLLSSNDTELKSNPNKDYWLNTLEQIGERGTNYHKELDARYDTDHDYNMNHMNKFAQAYFSGFTGFKMKKKFASCSDCVSSMFKEKADCIRDAMIQHLSEGRLKYPTDSLFELTSTIEKALLKTIEQEELQCFTFLHMADNILKESLTFVGCQEHQDSLTKSVIDYYAITRSRILVKKYNLIYDQAKKQEKEHRKRAKMISVSQKKLMETEAVQNLKPAAVKKIRAKVIAASKKKSRPVSKEKTELKRRQIRNNYVRNVRAAKENVINAQNPKTS